MEAKKISQKELMTQFKQFLEEKGFDIQQELGLCLSDIPKTHMRKGTNGKIYVEFADHTDLGFQVDFVNIDFDAHCCKSFIADNTISSYTQYFLNLLGSSHSTAIPSPIPPIIGKSQHGAKITALP